jgi:MYXO-CTERM domain-containing protein
MKRLGPMIAILLAATPAMAYVRTTNNNGSLTAWHTSTVSVEAPATPPPGMSSADTSAAIGQAMRAWSFPGVPCTTLHLMLSPSLGTPPQVANDMHAQIIVRTDRWCDGSNCHDPQQLAITSVFARSSDGEIVDADIEINAVDHHWTSIPDSGVNPAPGSADLANFLTHELGHLIGLSDVCTNASGPAPPRDHLGNPAPSCGAAPPELREATMFPDAIADDIRKRTLGFDDIQGVCAIYPRLDAPALDAGSASADASDVTAHLEAGSPVTDTGATADAGASADAGTTATATTDGCGCRLGGAGSTSGPALLLLLAALWARRRRVH